MLGGLKVTRHGKKGGEKNQKKILNQGAKWNKKIGGRSFVIICGAFMDTLLHCSTALSIVVNCTVVKCDAVHDCTVLCNAV